MNCTELDVAVEDMRSLVNVGMRRSARFARSAAADRHESRRLASSSSERRPLRALALPGVLRKFGVAVADGAGPGALLGITCDFAGEDGCFGRIWTSTRLCTCMQ